MTIDRADITAAEVALPCTDLEQTRAFFTGVLGFSLVSIFPADAPRTAVLQGYGVRLRLQQGASGSPGVLRLYCDDLERRADGQSELVAPNGTLIELLQAATAPVVPALESSFVTSRLSDDQSFGAGRAGMQYRDLIPGRQGGRFIASHIRIEQGGPVPDYVHFHNIVFQLIYCYKGWVRVVYEDQGPPFVLHAGDCVLQPPNIRHRVLENSDGMEVIEISCPAEHETLVEHELELPTRAVDAARQFSGQRFVRHQADTAAWRAWRVGGFAARDLGVKAGSNGVVAAHVIQPAGDRDTAAHTHDSELMFWFVLHGELTLEQPGDGTASFAAGDACVIPAGMPYAVARCSDELEFLEVMVPKEAR